jgi:hypothetical protein
MKKHLLLLILFFNLFVTYSQSINLAPKKDAVGKDALWGKYTHPELFKILNRTKKIAIIPPSTALFSRSTNQEFLRQTQERLNVVSSKFQTVYFTLLSKKSLSLLIQNPDETNKILSERNLVNLETLQKIPKNNLCFILGVDAVMFIDVTMENLKSQVTEAYLNAISIKSTTDELGIGLRIHERANGDFIWSNKFYEKVKSNESDVDIFRNIINSSIPALPFVLK